MNLVSSDYVDKNVFIKYPLGQNPNVPGVGQIVEVIKAHTQVSRDKLKLFYGRDWTTNLSTDYDRVVIKKDDGYLVVPADQTFKECVVVV